MNRTYILNWKLVIFSRDVQEGASHRIWLPLLLNWKQERIHFAHVCLNSLTRTGNLVLKICLKAAKLTALKMWEPFWKRQSCWAWKLLMCPQQAVKHDQQLTNRILTTRPKGMGMATPQCPFSRWLHEFYYYDHVCGISVQHELREEMTLMLPPVWIMVLPYVGVGLTLYAILKRVSRDLESAAAFQRWTPWTGAEKLACTHLSPSRANPWFPHGWLKLSGSPECLHVEWWAIVVRWTRNIIHPRTIPALDGLTLEFPWDPG